MIQAVLVDLCHFAALNVIWIADLQRDSGRPYWPKPRPERANEEEEDDLFFHPSVPRVSPNFLLIVDKMSCSLRRKYGGVNFSPKDKQPLRGV